MKILIIGVLILISICLIASIIQLFRSQFKSSFLFFLGGLGPIVIVLFVVFSSFGQTVLTILSHKHLIVGNSGDSIEAYRKVLNQKCEGEIFQKCFKSDPDLAVLNMCLFDNYGKLPYSCSGFLSNNAVPLQPLKENMVLGGVSFPKGTQLYKTNGKYARATIPHDWIFFGIKCKKGRVNFAHWNTKRGDDIKPREGVSQLCP